MDLNEVYLAIYDSLHNNPEHPMNERCAYNYYNEFWKAIEILYRDNRFKSKSDIDTICQKLCFNKN